MPGPRRAAVPVAMLILLGTLALPAVRATATPPEGVVPDLAALGWVKVLDDQFNGTAVDESVWKTREGPGVSGPGWNTRDAVRVSGGELSITTYSVDTNGAEPGGLEHRTGELETARGGASEADATGFLATYGYIEARVKLNNAPATRSAFWMLSTPWHRAPWGDPADAGPEIDIFEFENPAAGDRLPAPNGDGKCDWQIVEVPCDRLAGGTMHWGGFEEDHGVSSQQVAWTGPSPQGNFLTYGLLWTPDGYRMYRNGFEVFRSSEVITYRPEYLILTQMQGGVLDDGDDVPPGGYGDLLTSPWKMVVDYVTVWQRPISELPDRTVAANTPVAIPFSVTDHLSSGTSPSVRPQPGSVRVTATSNNPAVVPNSRIAVTGNGPAAPAGSLQNTGFESGLGGWTTPAGTATTWTTRQHSGASALRLTQAGGRVEQTVTGLRANTTYLVGGFLNVELDPASGDGDARVDAGLVDVDASRAGPQEIRITRSRNAAQEAGKWWAPTNATWREVRLSFTTGPGTTQVTFFVDNMLYAGGGADSDLSFDDVYLRPLVPPNRTVTVRPVDNVDGSATITLTARGAANQVLGTEAFTVTFTRGSTFTNGDFESSPSGAGWELYDGAPGRGAEVVVENPFRLNRVLELAGPANEPDTASRSIGTAFQRVRSLRPGTAYTLTVRGKGGLAFGVQEHAGPGSQVDDTISTPDWSTRSITFTTGPSITTANVFLLDWAPDAVSLVDDVRLTPVSTAGQSTPPLAAVPLTALGEQRLVSSAPSVVSLATSNTTITSVTSSNPALVPDANLAASPSTLSITPVPDRTGRATVTVAYRVSGVTQPPKQVPVVVSDRLLTNPGFEHGGYGWSGATVAGPARSGAGALRLDGTGEVSQSLTGLPHGAGFVVGGWHSGPVRVKIRRVASAESRHGGGLGDPYPGYGFGDADAVVADWTGSGWVEHQVRGAVAACQDCHAAGSYIRVGSGATSRIVSVPGGQIDIVLSDANPTDGVPVYVDDLYLIQVPALSPVRELSLHRNQTSFDASTGRTFDVGRVPANSFWNPTVTSVTSADTAVLPAANLRLSGPDPFREYEWAVQTRTAAGLATGRSAVTVRLTDPATGLSTARTATVTVNAGTSFNNGDFQRGVGNWVHAWFNDSWEIVARQRWRHLGPTDADRVLRISSGIIGYRVTGLAPGTTYVVRGSAVGDGSTLQVRSHHPDCTNPVCEAIFGATKGSVPISSATWAPTPDLVFTTLAGETEVWLFVSDADLADGPDEDTQVDPDDAVPASGTPCAGDYTGGEVCLDDIGIFVA